jgi:hypothetical protein
MENNIYIIAVGKVNKSLLHPYEDQLARFLKHRENEELLYLGYSEFEIPQGQKFEVVFDCHQPDIVFEFSNCFLKFITQEMHIEWDSIPKGYKTFALFEFEAAIPNLIKHLRIIDSWSRGGDLTIWLSDMEFWRDYKDHPEKWSKFIPEYE